MSDPTLRGKKVLVTGADGFIGSHLVERLLADGAAVRAFVMYNSFGSWGWLDTLPADVAVGLDVVAGDIRDPHAVLSAMEGCDIVLHLAALIAIPYSYLAPQSYVDTNVSGTLNVVQAARTLGVGRVVHTSTSECYGTARFVPITEDHPLQPQSPYSASKIGADQIALSYYMSFDVPVAVIRPFNTYGPRQSARAVIPTIIGQIAAGKREIALGTTTPTRDFNYVADTVDGFVRMATAPGVDGEIVNVGGSNEISVGDLANLIADVMDTEIEIVSEAERLRPDASEVERLFADRSKAETLLNWSPAHGGRDGLAVGLRKTADWFRDPDNLARYKTDSYVV